MFQSNIASELMELRMQIYSRKHHADFKIGNVDIMGFLAFNFNK